MNKLKITVGAKTDKGLVKQVNQDALLCKLGIIDKNEFGLFVVCDGLGGLEYGEIASSKTIEYFEKWWNTQLKSILKIKNNEKLIRTSLEEVLFKSNEELIELSNEINSKVGTTVSALFILNNNYYIVHIGDSRIYEINKKMVQLTEDHSQYEMLRKQGIKNLEKVKKNVLTQCIGVNKTLDIFYKKGKIKKNTNFLICSDGLHNKMDEEYVIKSFEESSKEIKQEILQEMCGNFINEVKEKKERDNITAIVINVKRKNNKRKSIVMPLLTLISLVCLCLSMLVIKSQYNKVRNEEYIIKNTMEILQEIQPENITDFIEKYEQKIGEENLSDEIKKLFNSYEKNIVQTTNSQTNSQIEDNISVEDTSQELINIVDKSKLKALIDEVQKLYDRSIEGNEENQYKIGSRKTLLEAINKAKNIYNYETPNQKIIDNEVNLLQEALYTFEENKN